MGAFAPLPGAASPSEPPLRMREEVKVVLASSFGTIFEWYDFFLYGALAPVLARKFFSGVDEPAAFLFALLGFSAGFAVRPIGARGEGSGLGPASVRQIAELHGGAMELQDAPSGGLRVIVTLPEGPRQRTHT